MSEMMLAHATPAANTAPAKQQPVKASGDVKNSTEISEGSGTFSRALESQAGAAGQTRSGGENLNGESQVEGGAAVVATELAADGNGLPAELLESLPEELIELLESLPEDVMDQIVQQFNEWATPQMAIPAQQKILVKEIHAVLKHLPDVARPMVDAIKLLPEGLKVAEQQVSDEAADQLLQLKKMFSQAGEDISSKTRSAFQQLAAQLLRPTTSNAATGGERSVLPEAALTALNAMQSEATQTQAAHRATPSTQLHVPFQQPGWDNALSERIVWMANQKLQSAEIKMNPPHLGPIEVRLNISGDQAQVQFTAHHGVVREALESALPRLREMFGANGLNLADVNVSDQSGADKRRSAESSEDGRNNSAFGQNLQEMDEDAESVSGISLLNTSTPMGAIDYFV